MKENPETTAKQAFVAAEHCHTLLHEVFSRLKNRKDLPQGPLDNIEILCKHMTRVRTFTDASIPKKIGVFGRPKQGKSSLLNALMGVEILPTGRATTSRAVIEIHGRGTGNDNPFEVLVTEDDGFQEKHFPADPHRVLEITTQYGAHGKSPNQQSAKKITVVGNFPNSNIFGDNAHLLDTPGAETAFEDLDKKSAEDREGKKLKEDTDRALAMLDETHVVLFITGVAQLESPSAMKFYKEYLRIRRPLCIVNFLDKWCPEEENGNTDPCRIASKIYGFPMDRTLAVSSKWAEEAKYEKTLRDKDAWVKSGMPALEDVIRRDLQTLTPEKAIGFSLDNLVTALNELNQSLETRKQYFPRRVEVVSLQDALAQCDGSWALSIIEKLTALSHKWFL